MEPTTVIAIISASIKLIDTIKEDEFQSTVLAEFEDLKNYMKLINQKVDILILQNQVVLDRLDRLPNEILQITDTVVSNHLLEERYTNIQGRLTLYTSVDDWADWENNYEGWKDYYYDLNYLFLREYRMGHMPHLIPACELAISVYKGFAFPVVKVLLDQKLHRLHSAQEILRDDIQEKLDKLLTLLGNTTYIASHILDENLDDLRKQLYVGHGHKNRSQSYTQEVCRTVDDAGCCRSHRVCKNVTKTRQVADTAYNSRHDQHVAKLTKQQNVLVSSLTQYVEASLVIDLLESYQTSVMRDNISTALLVNDEVEFVSPGTDEIMEQGLVSAPLNMLIRRPGGCYTR